MRDFLDCFSLRQSRLSLWLNWFIRTKTYYILHFTLLNKSFHNILLTKPRVVTSVYRYFFIYLSRNFLIIWSLGQIRFIKSVVMKDILFVQINKAVTYLRRFNTILQFAVGHPTVDAPLKQFTVFSLMISGFPQICYV